jgi:glutathione S-transferase
MSARMKLYYSPASPYARKVLVVAHETGAFERLTLEEVKLLPSAPTLSFAATNPLMKVPALQLENGQTLFDSRVIAEYLDSLHDGRLFATGTAQAWAQRTWQALADGLLDAALLVRYERVLRPEDKRWDAWQSGQLEKISQVLKAWEPLAAGFDAASPLIGEIAVSCALGYLDFRFPELPWRQDRPRLAGFYEQISQRESMQATRPG